MTHQTFALRPFKYINPVSDRVNQVVRPAKTDRMRALGHVLKKGGENNFHSHAQQDGLWIVVRRAPRFYEEGNEVLWELGPNEGILIPRRFRYWFESCGSTEPELFHVIELDPPQADERQVAKDCVGYVPPKTDISVMPIVDAGR